MTTMTTQTRITSVSAWQIALDLGTLAAGAVVMGVVIGLAWAAVVAGLALVTA